MLRGDLKYLSIWPVSLAWKKSWVLSPAPYKLLSGGCTPRHWGVVGKEDQIKVSISYVPS